MIILTIDNSYSQMHNLTREQHGALAELMSYSLDPTARFFSGGYGPRKVSLLTKKGVFPTGLLYLAFYFLEKTQLEHSLNDVRIPKMPQDRFKQLTLGYEPYEAQRAAVEAARWFKRGIIVAPTGFGKSVIIALIINKLQVPTLIVVPTLELKRQLTDTLTGIFGAKHLGKDIVVENIGSNALSKIKSGFDCVIIDEFHHSAAKTYRDLNKKNWTKVFYRFGLTATPFRSDDNERLLLESMLSNVIYRVEYKDAVESGHIVPMEAYYVDVPRSKTDGTGWSKVYSDLVVNNHGRNAIIASLLNSLRVSKISTLCLVKEIRHGEILGGASKTFFANGQVEETKELIDYFNQGAIHTLIGTTGVLGEGVDTKPAEFVIIAGLGKSKNAFMQQCGRGFRRHGDKRSCKIIIFRDMSHKFTRAHFKEQCKHLLEEYGIIPAELKIDL